jgi:SWI/SNF-related matrix-associated actin-dependent regulator 1 of chromatin subfamily A
MSGALDERMGALRRELAELQRQKDEADRLNRLAAIADRERSENERAVTVVIKDAHALAFQVAAESRPDLVAYWMTWRNLSCATGPYGGWLPTAEFKNVVKHLEGMKNVRLIIEKKVKDFMFEYFDQPKYRITLTSNGLRINVSPRGNASYISHVPGARYNDDRHWYDVPLTEAWRLLDDERLDEVVWSNEAKKYAIDQMESRVKLNAAATAVDAEINVDFRNGIVPRPFQRVGIAFASASGGRCLIADQVGLGKSLQYIGYVQHAELKCNVIVCKAGLKWNWFFEINKLTGDQPYVVTGVNPSKSDIVELAMKRPRWIIISFNALASNHHVEETKTDEKGFRNVVKQHIWPWVNAIDMLSPDSLCIDEAHLIKNPEASRTQACMKLDGIPHIIELTGTPLLNRPGELWTLLHLLKPEQFPSQDAFVRQYTIDGKLARNVQELRSLLLPLMIRRRKSEVMADLPPVNRIYEHHELSGDALKAYDKVLKGIYEEMSSWGDDEVSAHAKSVTNVLTEILRLKQICALDKIETTVDLAREAFEGFDDDEPNHKILIGSQFIEVVDRIKHELGPRACSFTGSMDPRRRQDLINEFQTSDTYDYMVVSMAAAQEGYTITRAGVIITNDFMWTPASHEQFEGRAYGRLNDAHGISSYYIAAMNTIEDWIQKLLSQKLGTFNQIIEGHAADRVEGGMAMDIITMMREEMRKRR